MSLRVGLDARFAARGLGISTMVVEVARAIAPYVELVWYGDPRMAPPGVAATRPLWTPFPMLDGPAGRLLAKRDALDVVHFAANCGWTTTGPVPVVLTIHDLIFMQPGASGRSLRQRIGRRYMRWVVPRAARAASVLTAPSAASARAVEENFGRAARVIPNGVAPPEALSAADGEDVVVFAGRDPRKGALTALEAWRAADVRGRLIVLAGAGLPDGFEEAAREDLSHGRVVIHGYVSRPELWELLGSARALLHLSRQEGFGLPVLEAMAVGVPVIGGLTEAAREVGGECLLAVDPANPVGSAAAALRGLDADPEARGALSVAGRLRARSWTWSRAAHGYLDAYRAALEALRE